MASLVTLTYSQPILNLNKGDVLITQGMTGGDLFVLESGRLVVERDGVAIAHVEEPNSVVGEMSVLLGKPYSATVKAEGRAAVRVVRDAMRILDRQPALTLQIAILACQRLDATSALLVEMSREHGEDATHEHGFIGRLMKTLLNAPKGEAEGAATKA